MGNRLRITVLVENFAGRRGVLAEHGLAFGINLRGRTALFDTGQGLALAHNAKVLSFDLGGVGDVILSHGHYDHADGLGEVFKAGSHARMYVHPAAIAPKYARSDDGESHDIGMSPATKELIHKCGDRVTWTRQPTEVYEGLFVTGEIPRRTEYEDVGGPFCSDQGGQPDPLIDDQAVFVDTRLGTVVLLGCGHAGVVNTLLHVGELTGGRPIHAVMGGMHLVNASRERVQRTIDDLRGLDIARMGPGHCTGHAAIAKLWSAFPGTCHPCATGMTMEFEIDDA